MSLELINSLLALVKNYLLDFYSVHYRQASPPNPSFHSETLQNIPFSISHEAVSMPYFEDFLYRHQI